MEEADTKRSKKIALIGLGILILVSVLLLIILPIGPAIFIILFPISLVLIYFILKIIIRSTFWNIFLTIILWALVLIIFSAYMYFSITNFIQDIQDKPLYVTLEKQDAILIALQILPGEKIPYKLIEQTINKDGGIEIILTEEFFSPIDKIELPGVHIELTKQQLFEIIESKNTEKILQNFLPPSMKSIPIDLVQKNSNMDLSQIKVIVLGLLIYETLNKEGTTYFVTAYKDNTLKIDGIPISIEILLTLIPESLIKEFLPQELQQIPSIPGSQLDELIPKSPLQIRS